MSAFGRMTHAWLFTVAFTDYVLDQFTDRR
jgi:hypothetical protein